MKKEYFIIVIGLIIVLVIIFFPMKDEKITKNFSLYEFTKNGKFKMTPEKKQNLRALVENILQPLRDYLGKAITVTSGYRPTLYNASIGGAPNSQHLYYTDNSAADIYVNGLTNNEIIQAVKHLNLPVDQIIDEEKINGSTWVHISHKREKHNRGLITLAREKADGEMVYENIGYV